MFKLFEVSKKFASILNNEIVDNIVYQIDIHSNFPDEIPNKIKIFNTYEQATRATNEYIKLYNLKWIHLPKNNFIEYKKDDDIGSISWKYKTLGNAKNKKAELYLSRISLPDYHNKKISKLGLRIFYIYQCLLKLGFKSQFIKAINKIISKDQEFLLTIDPDLYNILINYLIVDDKFLTLNEINVGLDELEENGYDFRSFS